MIDVNETAVRKSLAKVLASAYEKAKDVLYTTSFDDVIWFDVARKDSTCKHHVRIEIYPYKNTNKKEPHNGSDSI